MIIFFLAFSIILIAGDNMCPQKLYFYKKSDWEKVLRKLGYDDFFYQGDVRRNSKGTSLRFFFKKKAVELFCDGSVKEIALPENWVWLNDNGDTVALFDGDYIYYKNGIVEKRTGINAYDIDESGTYFTKSLYISDTPIFHIDDPLNPIFIIKNFGADRIFYGNSFIYVFGALDDLTMAYFKYDVRRKGNSNKDFFPEKISYKFIPFQNSIIDFNICSEEILFVETGEPHPEFLALFTGKWWYYNLKTKRFKSSFFPLKPNPIKCYLQCDLLKVFKDKIKKEKTKKKK